MNFLTTLISVLILLLYAVPGFILSKAKAVKTDALPAFSKVLMYVCQPCLTLYTFNDAQFSRELFVQLILFFVGITAVQLAVMGIVYLVLKKKQQDVRYRIYTVASVFGNCAFFGVPLLEALLPDTGAVIFTNMYFVSMNLIAWTLACAVISRDKKYISLKKVVLNPAMLVTVVALPLFIFGIKMPAPLYGAVATVGKMTTPLCMIILGIRLGSMSLKKIFNVPSRYLTVLVKQVVFPLIALSVSFLLPFDGYVRQTFFILAACPVASIVLNFSEMLGEGQEDAACMVLLGTILCVVTMPLLLLIL